MDYLDPVKKKQHIKRLYLGYSLMAMLIALTTIIMVYLASGYYVDRRTGDLIQNGQIVVASDPEGASVYLDNRLQKTKTTGKLVVPSGIYTLSVKKDGYRDWSQQVSLDGGTIQRLDYIKLIPAELKSTIVQTFISSPTQVIQSDNQRYLAMIFAEKPLSIQIYDLLKPEQAPVEVTVPLSTMQDVTKIGTLNILEWASDDKHMLIAHTVDSSVKDYLLVSRDTTDPVVNLTSRYTVAGSEIRLQHKQKDKYFVYNSSTKVLSIADSGDKLLTARLQNVEQFVAYDNNTILYTTLSETDKTKMSVRMTDGIDSTYLMRDLSIQPKYLLGVTKYGSTTVAALGAPSENKITILRNPIGYLKADKSRNIPLATTIFHLDNPTSISFSTDGSVVLARSGRRIATHYFELDRSARFDSPLSIESSPVIWLDNMHLTAIVGGEAYIMDYDGSNIQKLVTTSAGLGIYLDASGNNLYSFTGSQKPFQISRTSLVVTD